MSLRCCAWLKLPAPSARRSCAREPVSTSTIGTQPRAHGRQGPFEAQPNVEPLHDFHPVTGGVLRRQHRELRTRARRDARHHCLERPAGIGVDLHRRRVTGKHVRELVFLEVRFHPDIVTRDEHERGSGGRQVASGLQVLHAGHDAVGGALTVV